MTPVEWLESEFERLFWNGAAWYLAETDDGSSKVNVVAVNIGRTRPRVMMIDLKTDNYCDADCYICNPLMGGDK